MGGLKLLYRLRDRLKRRPPSPLDMAETEHGFSIEKVRKLILSYQDGGALALWFPEDANLAAELGHLQLMRTLKGGFRYSVDAMDRAARKGLIDVLKYLHQRGQECTTEALDGAAKEGHLQVVIWLHRNTSAGATKAAMDSAASNGHLAVVEWLHHNRHEGCTVSAMNWAAEEGHLSVVKWLHRNRQEGCTTAAFDRAAMNNHMDVVMWLTRNRGEGGTESALQWAVSRGHTNMVALLSAPRTCRANSANSDQDFLKTRGSTVSLDSLALGLDSPGFSKTMSTGSFPLSRRQLSFTCSKYAMDKAAQGGHVEVLQLLHEQGHDCTTNAMDWAAAFGQTEAIKWLSAHRTEGCTKDAMDHAAAGGHLETVKWLHKNRREGCTRYALTDAAGNGHMETVKWLHHNRREGCGRRAMDDAAANGHLEMVRWLHHNRSEGCSTEAMERATRGGHLEVVKLLHELGATCTSIALHLAKVHGHHNVYQFLNKMYPGKAMLVDAYSDPTVVAEQEMVEQDRSLDLVVQQEARRRRQSVIFSESADAMRSRRRASLPISFGHNGKPALSRINTFGL
ncbi:unnamed protein product [Scytosiphon promiscuus]